MQLAILVLLWAAFLYSQMQKAQYNHCTWQFGAIAGAQALLLAAVTVAVMAYQSWKAKVRCCACFRRAFHAHCSQHSQRWTVRRHALSRGPSLNELRLQRLLTEGPKSCCVCVELAGHDGR